MEDKTKTIGYSSLAGIVAALLMLGGASLLGDDTYYCEARSNMVMPCEKLSGYYGLDNGKCYNSDIGNKLCRSGWLEVVDDRVLDEQEEEVDEDPDPEVPADKILRTNSGGRLQECSSDGCVMLQ